MGVAGEARAALGLLTVVPAGGRAADDDALAGAALWFPIVGALVGVVAAAGYLLVEPLLGATFAAVLALTLSALLAGGLHHDGLADTADGLGVRGDRARRLAAMRDPGIGSFGTLALIAFAALSLAALARLTPTDVVAALVAAHALGRWSAVAQLARLQPARDDGLGASFSATTATLALASIGAVAVTLAACGPAAGGAALIAAALAAAAAMLVARAGVGGRTGDTLGASVLLTEVAVYAVLAAVWGA